MFVRAATLRSVKTPVTQRAFTAASVQCKGPIDSAKDMMDKANHKVGEKAANVLDKGQKAKDNAKEKLHEKTNIGEHEVKAKAHKTKAEAENLKSEAKDKAEEVKQEFKK